MIYTASLTQKGQVTIPIAIRKQLGLKTNQKVVFIQKDNQVLIQAPTDFMALKGSLKSTKHFSDVDADKKVLSHFKKNND